MSLRKRDETVYFLKHKYNYDYAPYKNPNNPFHIKDPN
jgi:hypothetical protein